MKTLEQVLEDHRGESVSAYYMGGGLVWIDFAIGTPEEDACTVDDDVLYDLLGAAAYDVVRRHSCKGSPVTLILEMST